jgi:hypothetical protein
MESQSLWPLFIGAANQPSHRLRLHLLPQRVDVGCQRSDVARMTRGHIQEHDREHGNAANLMIHPAIPGSITAALVMIQAGHGFVELNSALRSTRPAVRAEVSGDV